MPWRAFCTFATSLTCVAFVAHVRTFRVTRCANAGTEMVRRVRTRQHHPVARDPTRGWQSILTTSRSARALAVGPIAAQLDNIGGQIVRLTGAPIAGLVAWRVPTKKRLTNADGKVAFLNVELEDAIDTIRGADAPDLAAGLFERYVDFAPLHDLVRQACLNTPRRPRPLRPAPRPASARTRTPRRASGLHRLVRH